MTASVNVEEGMDLLHLSVITQADIAPEMHIILGLMIHV
jgi:hypothetical protein